MTLRPPFPRGILLVAAAVYSLFVVYGSLVPLDYRPMPLDEAVARFRAIPFLDLGIGSRADWVANVLLFVPLTFLWLGALWDRWYPGMQVLASLLVLAAALALSVGSEFTQLFFPPRTVSQNDLLAEAIGGLIGVVAWWAAGPRLADWMASWRVGHGSWSLERRLLYVYLAGLFAYNLLPLDLTISPVEVYHKLRAGRLVLVPFGGLPADPVQAIYEVITDIAVWVPVALLWRKTLGSTARALRNTLLAALLLEFLQLWVFSRVSDVTDVFTAALGAWLGVLLARRVGAAPSAASTAASTGGAGRAAGAGAGLLWLVAALAWTGVLAVVFWFPFDFNLDGQFLRERLLALKRAPFTAYYYGTEFRAATEVLHKVLFFAPLGFFLGFGMSRFRWRRSWIWGLGLAVAGSVAGVVEAGQLALPGKNADFTDWVLECLGAGLGLWLALALGRSGTKYVGDAPRRSRSGGAAG